MQIQIISVSVSVIIWILVICILSVSAASTSADNICICCICGPTVAVYFSGLVASVGLQWAHLCTKVPQTVKKGGGSAQNFYTCQIISVSANTPAVKMVHKLCICIYLYLWHLVSVCICAGNSIANNLPAQSAAVEMYLHSTLL